MEEKRAKDPGSSGGPSSLEETAAYYAHRGAKSLAGSRQLARYLKRADLGDILDIGCGDGTMLSAVSESARTIAAVDTSENAVTLARNRLANADVRKADVEAGLPFEDGSFDTIFFCDILEHLRQPVFALEETHRVLREGGWMLVTTPNPNSLFRVLKGKSWFALADPGHLLFYTAFSIRHVLQKTGFTIERQSIEGLTNTPLDPILALTRTGGTVVTVAQKI